MGQKFNPLDRRFNSTTVRICLLRFTTFLSVYLSIIAFRCCICCVCDKQKNNEMLNNHLLCVTQYVVWYVARIACQHRGPLLCNSIFNFYEKKVNILNAHSFLPLVAFPFVGCYFKLFQLFYLFEDKYQKIFVKSNFGILFILNLGNFLYICS